MYARGGGGKGAKGGGKNAGECGPGSAGGCPIRAMDAAGAYPTLEMWSSNEARKFAFDELFTLSEAFAHLHRLMLTRAGSKSSLLAFRNLWRVRC
jgi:hypothetical protein